MARGHMEGTHPSSTTLTSSSSSDSASRGFLPAGVAVVEVRPALKGEARKPGDSGIGSSLMVCRLLALANMQTRSLTLKRQEREDLPFSPALQGLRRRRTFLSGHICRFGGGLAATLQDEKQNNQILGKTLRALFGLCRRGKSVGDGSWQVLVRPLNMRANL